MRTLKWAALGVVGLMLGGCCTEAGCLNSVTFELGVAADQFVPDEPVQVRACLGSQCVVETLTLRSGETFATSDAPSSDALQYRSDLRTLVFKPPTGTGPGPHPVSLELTRQGNVVVSASRPSLEFKSFTPNGPFCTPVCWSGGFAL